MSARLLGLGFGCDMGTPHRKLVLLKLIDACDDDGSRIFPAVATIARAAQCSARQVQRELALMVDVGLLAVVREGGKGPGSTREYALDVTVLRRIETEGWQAVAEAAPAACADACDAGGNEDDAAKGDRESPLAEGTKGDSDAPSRVTGTADKGDKLSHPTPQTTPQTDPSVERERARAGGTPAAGAGRDAEDSPGRAAFEKRVMRFCSGRGFGAGVWPDWDTCGSLSWVGECFAALTPAQRAEAERWRDAYLLDVADRKLKPQPPGVWLKGRVWEGLDPAVLARAEKRLVARLDPEERARPDGWAACLGPVGMAWLFAELLTGQPRGEVRPGGFWAEARLRAEWPAVWRWKNLLQQQGGVVFAPRWHALKAAMEAAPAGGDMHAAWRAQFSERGWPWLSAFDGHPVLWAPKGGPAGLEAFDLALRQAQSDAGNTYDADRSEAAE